MDTTTLKTFNRLYPMFIDKYELLLPDANTDITVKINSVINYLNTVGKLTNDVVKDWNTVMQWVLNDGLTQTVSDKIDQMFTDGKFDEIISHYSDQIVSDFTTRLDTTNTNITTATQTAQTQIDLINQNQVAKQSDLDNTNSQLAQKASQSDLDTANSNIALKANQADLNATNSTLTAKVDKTYVDTKFGSMGSTKIFKGSCTFAALPTLSRR
jgi:hypothetical protein